MLDRTASQRVAPSLAAAYDSQRFAPLANAMLLLQLFALSTAFAPTRLRAAPTRLAATATEEDVRLRVTLATQTAGRSFSFDVQKQVWLYRRCPARYSVDGSGVEIVAEGAKSKLEPFLKWLEKATSGEPQGMSAESGDGGGLSSVEWLDAEGGIEGWTSEGVDLLGLTQAEGPGFLGAPAGADEASNDADLVEAVAAQAVAVEESVIDIEAAAAVAATKGVVGTVPQEIRESFVGKAFGAAALDVDAAASDDLDLSEEDLAAFARDLLGE